MTTYKVFWRDQRNDETPIVQANSYAEALKLAYEEIEVGLTEMKNATQCPRCDTIFEDLQPTQKCPHCDDEAVEAL